MTVVQTNTYSAEPGGNVLGDIVDLIYRGASLGEGACNFVDETNTRETTVGCSSDLVEF
jgi:hypothetical protein